MNFNAGTNMLDAIVLSVVAKETKEGTYGYKITQDVRQVIDVSESSLYPVLRRLQKEEYLGYLQFLYNVSRHNYHLLQKQILLYRLFLYLQLNIHDYQLFLNLSLKPTKSGILGFVGVIH